MEAQHHEHGPARPASTRAHTHAHDHAAHAHRAGSDGHGHGDLRATSTGRLRTALLLTLASMVAEILAGVVSHSLALLSDAGHLLADAGALGLALAAQRIAARPRSSARTYGSRRAETVAALVNSAALVVTAAWVMVEAVERLQHPPEIRGGWMFAVATLGLVFNLVAARVLSGGKGESNANTRAALAHVLSDVAGSTAAILAAILVLTLGWRRVDPAVSIVLSLLIVRVSWKMARETLDVLMEGAPAGLDLAALTNTIRETPGVADLHDLHAWRVSDGFDVVTVHVVLDGTRHGPDVSTDVAARIEREHAITHATVQAEAPSFVSRLHPPEALVRRRGPG